MEPNQVIDSKYRWGLLFSAFIIMMVMSIYQYSWSLFADTIRVQFNWPLSTISMTFTIFTIGATCIQPFSGYIADNYGPRTVAVAAAFMVSIGYILCSTAKIPALLYLYYGLGGIGVGILYGISAACAIKWFPDKRGLATGLVVFGFGAGAAVFNRIIERMLVSKGLDATFIYLGIVMLILLVPLSLFYKYPQQAVSGAKPPGKGPTPPSSDYAPLEMLKTHQWYLIYFSFSFTISIVLMFGAQMKMMAREFNLPAGYFSAVMVLFPLGNGLSRVVAGFISDKIGREKTMVIFYSLLGLSIFGFLFLANIPFLFVTMAFIAALLGGAPFALYPATIGDYYGVKNATTNYGITYTAKAFAGVISGWVSGLLVMTFGSYASPLIIVAVGSLLAAVISMPMFLKAPPNGKSR